MKNYFHIKSYSEKIANLFKSYVIVLLQLLILSSCLNKVDVDIKRKKQTNHSEKKDISISNIQFINNQIVVSGVNLDTVTNLDIKEGTNHLSLAIESKDHNSLVANTLSNVTFAVEKTFDFIFSNSYGASTFTVNFSLCESLLGGKQISCTQPNDNDVLAFNAGLNKWIPKSVNGLNYQGAWDANDSLPPGIVAGDYYIVSDANSPYQVGDWIVFNGTTFDRIDNSQMIISVFGRTGAITANKGDYNLNKLADVNLTIAPSNNQVLKYNGTEWVAGNVTLSETDPSVSAFAKTTLPTCTPGQVLSANGTTLTCVTDSSGAGSYTGVMNRLVLTDGSTGALTTSNVTNTEVSYLSGITSSVQSQIDGKLNSSSFVDWSSGAGVQTIDPSRLNLGSGNAGKVVVTNGSGFVVTAAATTTEVNYLTGVTSSIQTQLNSKLSSFTETDPGVSAFAKTTLPTCTPGQVLSANGTTLTCVTDSSGAGSYTGVMNRLVLTDGSTGALTTSNVTNTEAGYLSGVTSSIQTQLNSKLSSFTETDPGVSAFAKTTLPTCTPGQVLSANGTTLACVTDSSGAGTFTGTMNRLVLTDGSTGALTTSNVTNTEVGYLSGITSSVQTQLDGKLNSSSFVDWSSGAGVQTIDPSRLSLGMSNAGKAVVTNGSGLIVTATATSTEINYLTGVTSSIQNQLNSKLSSFTETDPGVAAFAKTGLPVCGAGQVLNSDGTTLTCVTDNSGAGAYTGTLNRVVLTDGSTGALTTSNVTQLEIAHLSGVTSAIQTQLNAKQATIINSTSLIAGSLETHLQNAVSIMPYNLGAGQTGEFRFYEISTNGSNYTGFKSPDALGSNIIYTLPIAAPLSGQVMSSTAAGVLSWIDIPSAPVSSVNTKTGAVVLTTSDVSEGTGLYHSSARVLSTVLAGLSTSTSAVITVADSVLVAFGKLQAQVSTQISSLATKADLTNLSQSITAGNLNVTTINAVPIPDLSKMVSNEGGATSMQIGTLAARPTAVPGNTGRMYVVNDAGNEAIYVSSGSSWIKIASKGLTETTAIEHGGTGSTAFTSNRAVVVNGTGSALIDGPSIDDTTAVAATIVKRGPAGEVVGQYLSPSTVVSENATCTVALGTIAKDANGNLLTCQ